MHNGFPLPSPFISELILQENVTRSIGNTKEGCFFLICNTDCGFKLKAWCVWFDLFYCKESSGLLTIISVFEFFFFFCCGLTFISLHNLPYSFLFNVCVTFVFVLPFIHYFNQLYFFLVLRSMCLISYRFFFIFCQLFTERTGRCIIHLILSKTNKKKERHRLEQAKPFQLEWHENIHAWINPAGNATQ